MFDRIELKLIGITYNQVESGVYAVILQEAEGSRRLPIIIGYNEAQSIECKLQDVAVPRPLTHDLLVSILTQFRMTLLEVWIHRLPSGVFAADLTVEGPRGEIQTIDARSSDAIALAIRTGAPIFTSAQLLEEAGITPTEAEKNRESKRRKDEERGYQPPRTRIRKETADAGYPALSTEVLEKYLARAVESENYEEAGKIKQEIDKRKNK